MKRSDKNKKPEPRKLGRPPIDPELKRDIIRHARFNGAEDAIVLQYAKRKQLTIGEAVRVLTLHGAALSDHTREATA